MWHVCMHTHMHACIYTHHAHTQCLQYPRAKLQTHLMQPIIYIYIYMCVCTRMHADVYIHVHICVYASTCIHDEAFSGHQCGELLLLAAVNFVRYWLSLTQLRV